MKTYLQRAHWWQTLRMRGRMMLMRKEMAQSRDEGEDDAAEEGDGTEYQENIMACGFLYL